MTYRTLSSLFGAALLLVACGDSDGKSSTGPEYGDDPFASYDEGNVTAIGVDPTSDSGAPDAPKAPTGEPIAVVTASGSDTNQCIQVSADLCVDPVAEGGKFCDEDGALDGPVDVIVVDGEVVDVICYPPADDPNRPVETVDTSTEGAVDIVQNANSTTVVFDEATNGEPIKADITIDGNNVAIYGNGPDNTIIDGDVILDGNNPRIRGITVMGNVVIKKNSGAVVLCVIHGNIELQEEASNNNVFVENVVYGDVIVPSNNNILSGNRVQGSWDVTGHGNICDRNESFSDDDADFVVDDDEIGDPLECLD